MATEHLLEHGDGAQARGGLQQRDNLSLPDGQQRGRAAAGRAKVLPLRRADGDPHPGERRWWRRCPARAAAIWAGVGSYDGACTVSLAGR